MRLFGRFAAEQNCGASTFWRNFSLQCSNTVSGTKFVSDFACVTLVFYYCQEAFLGPIRYFLTQVHLEPLWYFPDAMGAVCVVLAVQKDLSARSLRCLLFALAVIFYSLLGYFVSQSLASVFSTLKALMPLFCGLLLTRKALATPKTRGILLLLFLTACVGVMYSYYNSLPWQDLQFQGIGTAQQFHQLQWVKGGAVRLYGFSGDQHLAASSILAGIMLLCISLRRRHLISLLVLAIIAIFYTTSRTTLVSLCIFAVLYFVSKMDRRVAEQPMIRSVVAASYFAPVAILVVLAGSRFLSLQDVPSSFESLWIRGSYTWANAFSFADVAAPLAPIHGFGLGGFGFGLLQSDFAKYYVPVDNFVIYNYCCFGLPYFLFYIYQCLQFKREMDTSKALVFIVLAISGLTFRGWSDYLFMVLLGYSNQCVLLGHGTQDVVGLQGGVRGRVRRGVFWPRVMSSNHVPTIGRCGFEVALKTKHRGDRGELLG